MKKIKILKLTKEEVKEMQDAFSAKTEDERQAIGDFSKWVDDNRNQTHSTLKLIKDSQVWNDTEKLIKLMDLIKEVKKAKGFIFMEESDYREVLEILKLRPPTYSAQGQVIDSGFRLSGGESEKYAEVYQTFVDADDFEVKE